MSYILRRTQATTVSPRRRLASALIHVVLYIVLASVAC